ncbi:MAG: hypothetical protein ACOC44_05000 [Promethearchaeia archaeon]
MTKKGFKEPQKNKEKNKGEDNGDKPQFHMFNTISRENLDNFIDNLYNPHFLGSIHMKKETRQSSMNTKTEITDEILKNELKHKVDEGIKDTIFNPITKLLIVAMITFNLIYLLSIFF